MTSARAKLALGTAQFGLAYGISNVSGKVPSERVAAILDAAFDCGVDLIDTAAAYGDSEIALRPSLARYPVIGVVTKILPIEAGTSIASVEAAMRESLVRLGRSRLSALLVHRAADLLGPDGERLWKAMEKFRRETGTGRLGVSVYDGETLKEILRRHPVEIVQVPISLLDQRLVTDGSIAALKAAGIEIHARSIFLQGLVFMDPDRLPARVAPAAPALGRLRSACAEDGLQILDACLGFVAARPEIDRIVVGVTAADQIVAISRAVANLRTIREPERVAVYDRRIVDPTQWN